MRNESHNRSSAGTRPGRRRRCVVGWVCFALVTTASTPATARTIAGHVFVDSNGDGAFSSDEDGVPNVVVFWETTVWTVTDATGAFAIKAPEVAGIVWARTPDGFLAGPKWAFVERTVDARVDLALRADTLDTPFSFVVASDTHVGVSGFSSDDVDTALIQTANVYPTPHFLVVTGDITQSNEPGQFDRVVALADVLPFPYVPVPGNHDWYDGGDAYRSYFGPPSYSFDSGGIHFVVLNDAASLEERTEFLARDLNTVSLERTVVALMHAPPRGALKDSLVAAGVEYLFTGHQHASRVLVHDGLTEYNLQPLGMGGIDHTPAGFRVVSSFEGSDLNIGHRTLVDAPLISLVRPRPNDVIPRCDGELLAVVEIGGTLVDVTARVDGVDVPISHVGGWVFRAELPDPCRPGPREVIVDAIDGNEQGVSHTQEVVVGNCRIGDVVLGQWPQFQGDASHHGTSPDEIEPPLRSLWTADVGGHLQGGSPVVSGGRLYVSIVDYADGSGGGVVALDAATGQELWRHVTGQSVRNAPAVANNRVVVVSNDGTVLGLHAATGELIWSYDLAEDVDEPVLRNAYAAPAIVDGVAYVGIKRELVALDAADGTVAWSVAPFESGGDTSSYATPAVRDGVVIQSFSRGTDGLVAFDQDDGGELWRTDPAISYHLNAAPIVARGQVLAINESGELSSIELDTGDVSWSLPLLEDTFQWAFGVMATGAMSDDRLFVGTQYGTVHGIDTVNGVERWRVDVDSPGPVRTSHYRGEVSAISASLAVAGEIVWVGTTSGMLLGLDVQSGLPVWETDLGAPVLSGPVPAGDVLFVATYDGTGRALVTEDAACVFTQLHLPASRLEVAAGGAGCGCSSRDGQPGGLLVVLALYFLVAGRRRSSLRCARGGL